MNVETERLDTQEAMLTVSVEAAELEKAKRRAAKRLAQRVNIPGFRKGKAPYARVLQLLGEGAIFEEALEDLGQQVYSEALDESGLNPYAPGTLENVETDPELVLSFKVPLQPEIDLGNYREVRVPFEKPQVTDEAVKEVLEDLRVRRAIVEPVTRAANWGDVATLDLFGELLPEGQEAPDEEAEVAPENLLIDEEAFELVLDRERDFLPGFAEQIVGLSAGDDKTFTLDVPEDFENEQMRGRRAAFDVTVESVSARTLPTLNDTFAADVTDGKHETLLDLRMEVRRQLEEHAIHEAEGSYLDDVMEKVLEGAQLAYPPMMVEEYIDQMLDTMDQDLRQRGLTLEDYQRINGKTREELAADVAESAERRLRRALVLGKVVAEEELAPDDADLMAEMDEMVEQLGGDLGLAWMGYLNRSETARENFRLDVMTRRAVKRLIAIAKGENPPKGPSPRPRKGEKVHSEHVATLDDLRDEIEAAEGAQEEERGKLFPGERMEGGIVRID